MAQRQVGAGLLRCHRRTVLGLGHVAREQQTTHRDRPGRERQSSHLSLLVLPWIPRTEPALGPLQALYEGRSVGLKRDGRLFGREDARHWRVHGRQTPPQSTPSSPTSRKPFRQVEAKQVRAEELLPVDSQTSPGAQSSSPLQPAPLTAHRHPGWQAVCDAQEGCTQTG